MRVLRRLCEKGAVLAVATDMDEALKYGAMIPTSEFGRIEVRPVMIWET